MGGADDIAFEFLLENLSITPLRSSRHGLTYEGESLVVVETAKLDHSSIQFKAMIGELRLAKTEAAPVLVEHRVSLPDANHEIV